MGLQSEALLGISLVPLHPLLRFFFNVALSQTVDGIGYAQSTSEEFRPWLKNLST